MLWRTVASTQFSWLQENLPPVSAWESWYGFNLSAILTTAHHFCHAHASLAAKHSLVDLPLQTSTSWKWMATSRATEAYTVKLIARCSGEEHQLSAKNQNWNVKRRHGMQIWICNNVLSIIRCVPAWIWKLWNLDQAWVRSTPRYIKHTSAKQAAAYDWQTPSLPVYVARHLFAPSLGYFSRRSHVWASACVPRIQMEAAVCKVSVRGEFIRGSRCPTSVWHTKSE